MDNDNSNNSLCYYCGREIADPNSAYKKALYKKIGWDTGSGFKKGEVSIGGIRYKVNEISVPRCKKCKKTQANGCWLIWLPPLLFSIAIIVLNFKDKNWIWC